MMPMRGFLLVRLLFIAVVVYASALIGPIQGHPSMNAGLGLFVALLIVVAEAQLRDTSVTRLLGGLLGFGVGLFIAKAIGSALFWANTGDAKVQFLHGLILIVLPYLGMVLGARRGPFRDTAARSE